MGEQLNEDYQISKIEEKQEEWEIEPTQSPWQTGVQQKVPSIFKYANIAMNK